MVYSYIFVLLLGLFFFGYQLAKKRIYVFSKKIKEHY
jgi:hypothetical protein